MYLVDTNIFLEILLNDPNKLNCEKFLNDNINNLYISDFSLHSIGIILWRRLLVPARLPDSVFYFGYQPRGTCEGVGIFFVYIKILKVSSLLFLQNLYVHSKPI